MEKILPSGATYEMKEYVTGYDMRQVSKAVGDDDKVADAMIVAGLKKLNGNEVDILDRALRLPISDFVFIMKEVSALFQFDAEKKTTLQDNAPTSPQA